MFPRVSPNDLGPDFQVKITTVPVAAGILTTMLPFNSNRFSFAVIPSAATFNYSPNSTIAAGTGFQVSASTMPYTWLFPWHGPLVFGPWFVLSVGVNTVLIAEVLYIPKQRTEE